MRTDPTNAEILAALDEIVTGFTFGTATVSRYDADGDGTDENVKYVDGSAGVTAAKTWLSSYTPSNPLKWSPGL